MSSLNGRARPSSPMLNSAAQTTTALQLQNKRLALAIPQNWMKALQTLTLHVTLISCARLRMVMFQGTQKRYDYGIEKLVRKLNVYLHLRIKWGSWRRHYPKSRKIKLCMAKCLSHQAKIELMMFQIKPKLNLKWVRSHFYTVRVSRMFERHTHSHINFLMTLTRWVCRWNLIRKSIN